MSSWILLLFWEVIRHDLNGSHLPLSLMCGLDMIEHPFSVILDPFSLVDGLLILEEIDDYLALVLVVPKDKVSAQRKITNQLLPTLFIPHIYLACPYLSYAFFSEYLRDTRVDLPEVFKHHVLPLLLGDFWRHLQSDGEEGSEGVGLFGVVEQLASQLRRGFEEMQAELLEDLEGFGAVRVFEVGFYHRFFLLMQESLHLHVLQPSLADLSHKDGQTLFKSPLFCFVQLHIFNLIKVQQLDRTYELSILLLDFLQSYCYFAQLLHQLVICRLSLPLHVELNHRLYFFLPFQSQQKPAQAVLPAYLIYFPQHRLLYSIQYVSLKSSIAVLKGLHIQIQLPLDDLILKNPFLYEPLRFFLRLKLQKEAIIAFIKPPDRIENLRRGQILSQHLHIDCLLQITDHDCPYFLISLHLTYILDNK